MTELVETEKRLSKLLPLSENEKAKLEISRNIDHLYYSSKIEGTTFTDKRINKAVKGV